MLSSFLYLTFFIFLHFILIKFYWSIAALKCHVVFNAQQHESAIHTPTFPPELAPHPGHCGAPSRAPCAVRCVLISINSPCVSAPVSQFLPPSSFPLGVHTFILYFCVSISALQIRSFIPFFQIPHTCISIQFFFSLLHLTFLK